MSDVILNLPPSFGTQSLRGNFSAEAIFLPRAAILPLSRKREDGILEQFSLKPKLYFGGDPLGALDQLTGLRVFIVTDAFLAGSGLLERVTARLTGPIEVFDRVEPDPSLQLVAQGVAQAQRFGPQAMLAFGGGSPMDCAKAIRYFAQLDCPLWCVPTTAGTGSEVTSFAILTDTEKGAKYPLVDDSLIPDAAILDPAFLAGVPPAVTADTGMDVLTHAAEAYVARKANSFTDSMAEKAFAMAYRRLSAAHRGDPEAKADMLEASCLAGMAFNAAGLGVCHSLAHALGGAYHLPHGRINAILLPGVIAWHEEASPETAKKYAALAKLCGLSPTARALSSGLRRLALSVGEPQRFPQPVDIPRIAAQALGDRCTDTDPALVTDQALRKILEGIR